MPSPSFNLHERKSAPRKSAPPCMVLHYYYATFVMAWRIAARLGDAAVVRVAFAQRPPLAQALGLRRQARCATVGAARLSRSGLRADRRAPSPRRSGVVVCGDGRNARIASEAPSMRRVSAAQTARAGSQSACGVQGETGARERGRAALHASSRPRWRRSPPPALNARSGVQRQGRCANAGAESSARSSLPAPEAISDGRAARRAAGAARRAHGEDAAWNARRMAPTEAPITARR